jgi:hypothetical protein
MKFGFSGVIFTFRGALFETLARRFCFKILEMVIRGALFTCCESITSCILW